MAKHLGNPPMPLGVYLHFKGWEVTVISVARHSETDEEHVVYECKGELYIRPREMFEGYLDRDGNHYKRFTFLREV